MHANVVLSQRENVKFNEEIDQQAKDDDDQILLTLMTSSFRTEKNS